ncbi:MAG TPA: methyltransferase domain-containing protein [Solirubrobacteraceae bacterium]|nr:methyltransferase domain-containing protein [Solirubrobacteraceae bacterium]
MESVLLERYRSALQGSVLDLVPGGSRLTKELVHQAGDYLGVGPSPAVINVCRQMYLTGRFVVADIDALEQFESGRFQVVFGGRCAIDSLNGERRRGLFERVRQLLDSEGLWIFSSHNAASAQLQQADEAVPDRRRGGRLRGLRLRSSRAPMDEHDLGAELLSGMDGTLSAGPYRITKAAQEAQLDELGFTLLECLDLDGHAVPEAGLAPESAELHYVARPVPVAT